MKKLMIAGVCAAVLVSLTACSAGSSTSSAPAASASAGSSTSSIRSLVPAAIKSSGTIQGGANFQAAPLAMYASDGTTPDGAVVKLVEQAAKDMGLKVQWQQILYPDQIPAMQAGKIVVSGSASAANASIISAANVVGMFHNQQGILSLPSKAKGFTTVDGICGKTIGYGEAAAATVALFNSVAAKCKSDGKTAPKGLPLSATADIILAVQSGRADGGLIPTPTVVYTAKQSSGKLVATGEGAAMAKAFPQGDEGFTVAKNQLQLAQAFQAAFNKMMKDGSYQKIMKQFGVPQSQWRTTATLNKAS